MRADRLIAAALVVLVSTAIVGFSAGSTGASFTGTTTNPNQTWQTSNVAAPASTSTTSAAAGAVTLSWPATTTPANGHTVTYLVFRGATQVCSTSLLTCSDTPPADGSNSYSVQTKIAQGAGFFTSGNSPAQNGLSDRTAPTMSVTCNGGSCAGWFKANVTVVVSGNDGTGVGMGTATTKLDAAGALTSAAPRTITVSGQSSASGHTVVYSGADAVGNASGNTTANVKIDTTAPTAATAIVDNGTGQNNGELGVSWTRGTDALSGIAGQTLRRSGNVGAGACPAVGVAGYPNVVAGVGAATTSILITGLVSGGRYCFYVVTTDAAGNSTNSAASAKLTAN